MLVQILLIMFVVLIISRISDKYWRKEISVLEFLSWLLFWIVVGGFIILPEMSSRLAIFFGVGRGVDLMVYVSIIFIFYLLFRIFVRFEKQEREITKIVRKIALDEAEKGGDEK